MPFHIFALLKAFMELKDMTFKQTNGFAMQYAVVLGGWRLLGISCWIGSFACSALAPISLLMILGSFWVAWILACRFRSKVVTPTIGFSFLDGFRFIFLLGIYSALWVALGIFIYMAYIDGGYIFDAYEAMLTSPEMCNALKSNGTWDTIQELGGVEHLMTALRAIRPSDFSLVFLYTSLITSPFVALLIALACRRPPKMN